MQIALVTIASLLALLGNIPYLKSVWKGQVEPHAFTWFIWSIVSLVTFFGAVQKGGGLGTVPIFVSEIFTVIIFLFSLKNGFKHIHKTDVFFLIIALLGLVPWYFTSDPTISVIVVVCIDIVAFMPTIRKTFLHPNSENYLLYLTNVLRHGLILSSLDAYNIATTLHSVAMIIVNTCMTLIITTKKNV
jgi:hypothetical protein